MTTSSRRILITGARAPAALELVRSFAAAGHVVFTADSLRHPIAARSRFITRHFLVPSARFASAEFAGELRRIVRAEGIDLLLPTCEEIFFAARAGLSEAFLGAPELLLEVHDKGRFAALAARLGLAVPRTDDWSATASADAVWKPAFTRFGDETLLPPHLPATRDRVAREMAAGRRWIAQDFLRGRALCTYSVAWHGRLNAHAAYPVSVRVGAAAVAWEAVEHPGARAWVERFVAATGFHGQIAFDFIELPNGEIFAIECNPRATSGVHLFAGDARLAEAFLRPVAPTLSPRLGARISSKLALLLAGARGIREAGGLAAWLGWMFRTPDAVWRSDDQRPAFAQWALLRELRAIAARQQISTLAASTHDIAWNDELPS